MVFEVNPDPGAELASSSLRGETPRREAVRTLGAAGAAILGALGHGAAVEAKGKSARQQPSAAKKKKKKGPTVSVTAEYSDPFDVAAGGEHLESVSCPAGAYAIGGGVDTESINNCAIQESAPAAPDTWFANLTCTATGSATAARVVAVCVKAG